MKQNKRGCQQSLQIQYIKQLSYRFLIGCLCQKFTFRRLSARPEVTSTFHLNLHVMIKNNITTQVSLANTVLFTVSGCGVVVIEGSEQEGLIYSLPGHLILVGILNCCGYVTFICYDIIIIDTYVHMWILRTCVNEIALQPVCTLHEHLGYFNHVLRCISVTKECYQIGLLASPLRTPIFGYIPGISTITMQSRNSPGQICKIKETTNLTRNADLYAFGKETLIK